MKTVISDGRLCVYGLEAKRRELYNVTMVKGKE